MRRPLVVVLAIVLVVIPARGFFLATYRPAVSDRYLWGAFHVHSTLSDGLAPLEIIAAEARKARVSFVLLSDHGAPHPEAALLCQVLADSRGYGD